MVLLLRLVLIAALLVTGCSGKTKEELFAEGLKQISKGNPAGGIVLLKSALDKDQNFFEARYQLAKAYVAVSKYDQSEKEYQKVLLQNPSRVEIKLELAKLYNLNKKPDQAIPLAEEYLKIKPDQPDAYEVLGVAFAKKGKLAEAEIHLLKALKGDSRTSAKLELAAVYNLAGKNGDVRRLLNEVIQGDPKNYRANYMLATLENLAGNRDKALEMYRRVSEMNKADAGPLYKIGGIYLDRGETEKAAEIAEELARRFPKRPEGNLLKGVVHYNKKMYSEAILDLQGSLKTHPTIEAYYFLGLSLYNKGEMENALSQFRKSLDGNPSFHRARLLVAMILLKQKRTDDSIAEVKKLLESDPRNALAHNVLGSALMAKGKFEDGMTELNKALDLDPNIVDAHLKKGVFHLSAGKNREAEQDFETAIQVAPEMLATRLLLASYYVRQSEPAKAIALLRKGIVGKAGDAPLYNYLASIMFMQNKQSEGLTYLQQSKQADPRFFSAYFNVATFYAAQGDHDKAAKEYGEILKKDPGSVKALLSLAALHELKGNDSEALSYYTKAKETRTVVGFLAMANYYLKKKQNDKALAVFEEATRVLPRDSEILEMKGRVLVEKKDYKEAIRVFNDLESVNQDLALRLKIQTYIAMRDFSRATEQARRVMALKPTSAQGYLMLATVYESQGDIKTAIEQVKSGLRVDADNPNAFLMLGTLFAKNKDVTSAMNAYVQALKSNPDFAPALFSQGALLESTGSKKEAIKKYQAALAKSENFVPALNNLAYLYLEGHGKPQEALRLAMAGFRQEPWNPGIMDTLGYAMLKNGRAANAQKILEKAASSLPDNPTVAYHLALAYKENGLKEQAGATLRKALAFKEFPEADSARRQLEELKK